VKINQHKKLQLAVCALSAFSAGSMAATSSSQQNVLTATEVKEGWKLLFDGKTLDGWHLFQHPDAKPSWIVQDGTITVDLRTSGVQHGDLTSDAEFENYELAFEWKTTVDGNSGVFINVQENPENQLAWQTGPEYQLLGPEHIDNKKPAKNPGCLYGYSAQLTQTSVHEQGQWNQSVIKQNNGEVAFYLNGNLTAKVDLGSQEWKDWVSQSNFKSFADFGKATKGHIVLQEWTSPVAFRNIKIKEL